MNQSERDINIDLSRTVFKLLMTEPFYAHLIQNFSREVSDRVDTAAVTVSQGRIILVVNPSYFSNLIIENQRIGLLKHEVLHIVFQHLFRDEIKNTNALIYNIAADIVVNQCIEKKQLPPNPVTFESFPELQLKPNKSLKYYIEKLKSSIITNNNLYSVFKEGHSNHEHWEGHDANEDALNRSTIVTKLKEAIKSGRIQGILPQKIEEFLKINDLYESPQIDWKEGLRKFVGKTAQSQIRITNNRISKRYGIRPGVRIKNALKLLVAIDTSGSLSKEELEDFFSEINFLNRLVDDLTIIECDADITRLYKFERKKQHSVIGRGGTDFEPVIEYLNKNNTSYDGLIYFTDGFANQPNLKSYKPSLFVINNSKHKLKQTQNLYIIETLKK